MSSVFAQRVVVGESDEQGGGIISVTDPRLTPGDVVEIEVHPVQTKQSKGPLLGRTRALGLDLPPDYSTSFETYL